MNKKGFGTKQYRLQILEFIYFILDTKIRVVYINYLEQCTSSKSSRFIQQRNRNNLYLNLSVCMQATSIGKASE